MLKNENYSKQVLIGLVLTLVLLASFSFLMYEEWFSTTDNRLVEAAAEHDNELLRHGRELFIQNCTSCHGTRGEGIVGPALNNKTLLEAANDGVLFATIQTGRPNTTMPAWGQAYGGALTDEDIHAVVSFIRAFEPNAPEVIVGEFIPNASRGASLFASACFTCHGENGEGTDIAPAVNDSASLKAHDNAWYEQVIINGMPATGMPIWGSTLSNNQIQDLLALIEAWRNGEEVLPDTTVAQMLGSAYYALEQGDTANSLFYMQRATPFAFGPLLSDFDSISGQLEAGKEADALAALTTLRDAWPMGNAEVGETIFMETCSGCHGTEGQGGVGKKLHPSEFVGTSTNAEILAFVEVGKEGTAMQGYKGVLTEEQLADIIAFLKTWQE